MNTAADTRRFRTTCICPDSWCPVHAVCGACETPLIILSEDDLAFCESCEMDVMPKGACKT